MYSPSQKVFVFTSKNRPVQVGSAPHYRNKHEAVRAALKQGLLVDFAGKVTQVDDDDRAAYMAAHDKLTSDGEVVALEGMATLRTKVGTRVRFRPNPVSLALYSNPPAIGEEGEVTTTSFGAGGKRSFLKGPGGGLLYVKWDRLGTMGVSPRDVEVVGKKSGMRAGPGRPGMKFERDDVVIETTLHPIELDGLNKNDKLNRLDDFTRGYIEAALWSTNDESDESGGVPLDQNYETWDLTHEALDKMIKDCQSFQEENHELLSKIGNLLSGDAGRNGHDFWLTRNGHGAGFWDRDYDEEVGKGLTDAAHAYGTVNLYVSGGKIYHD
jgi:hypothetical protein